MALARDPSRDSLELASELLANARPTAVNLAWAVARVRAAAADAGSDGDRAAAALAEARAIEAEELASSDAIARHGAELLERRPADPDPLQHRRPRRPGPRDRAGRRRRTGRARHAREVLATESRPLLQGARLTVYELAPARDRARADRRLAAAGLLARGAADAVIVGCDRVAANGDVANKVGTYGLALAARAAGIPFVVAGPTSTIDLDTPPAPRSRSRSGTPTRSASPGRA